MTVLINGVTIQTIISSQYGPLSNGLGVVTLILLLLLLLERVLLEAFLGKSRPKILEVFDVAVIPLLIILAMLVGLRFAALLGYLRS